MSPPLIHPAAVEQVKLLLLDVDGVLTDGKLYYNNDSTTTKAFHVRDGLGIALLHQAGIETGIISGRDELSVRRRAEELGIAIVVLGEGRKGRVVERLLRERNLQPSQSAYLADDVNDLPALAKVGVPIAVADAHPDVLSFVRYVTRSGGGQGAVREVADAILGTGRDSFLEQEEVVQ
ncbi:MAG: HAD family hydrolase [Planctomycetota bacterium]